MLITLARKPLPKGVNVATNALQYGCGGINIDATRIAGVLPTPCFGTGWSWHDKNNALLGYRDKEYYADQAGAAYTPSQLGRWPANVLLCGKAVAILNAQSGVTTSSGGRVGKKAQGSVTNVPAGEYHAGNLGFGDTGGASRYFKQVGGSDNGEA